MAPLKGESTVVSLFNLCSITENLTKSGCNKNKPPAMLIRLNKTLSKNVNRDSNISIEPIVTCNRLNTEEMFTKRDLLPINFKIERDSNKPPERLANMSSNSII